MLVVHEVWATNIMTNMLPHMYSVMYVTTHV